MATRTLTFSQWLKLVVRHSLDNGFSNVAGHPPTDVAVKLAVSHERVKQLIREDVLDTIEVSNAAGRVCITLVTDASVERYLAKRVPDRNRQGYFAFPA